MTHTRTSSGRSKRGSCGVPNDALAPLLVVDDVIATADVEVTVGVAVDICGEVLLIADADETGTSGEGACALCCAHKSQ